MNLTQREEWFMDQHRMYVRDITNEDRKNACTDFQRNQANYIVGVDYKKGHEYFVKKVNLKTLKDCLSWAIDPRFNK